MLENKIVELEEKIKKLENEIVELAKAWAITSEHRNAYMRLCEKFMYILGPTRDVKTKYIKEAKAEYQFLTSTRI